MGNRTTNAYDIDKYADGSCYFVGFKFEEDLYPFPVTVLTIIFTFIALGSYFYEK